jgi:hypothetical protein
MTEKQYAAKKPLYYTKRWIYGKKNKTTLMIKKEETWTEND